MAQPAGPLQPRSDSADRILAAARELFGRDGYHRTTLKQIADRCGLTDAAILYHFRSKREILDAILVPPDLPSVPLPAEWDPEAFAAGVIELFYSFDGHWDLVRLIAVQGWFYKDPDTLVFGGGLEKRFRERFLPALQEHFPDEADEIAETIITFLQGFLLDRMISFGPQFEDVIAAPETRDHLERCVRTLLPPAPGTSAKCAP